MEYDSFGAVRMQRTNDEGDLKPSIHNNCIHFRCDLTQQINECIEHLVCMRVRARLSIVQCTMFYRFFLVQWRNLGRLHCMKFFFENFEKISLIDFHTIPCTSVIDFLPYLSLSLSSFPVHA